jgi:predicted DCC family thiol-disulfide oxidoreductase YuxK
MLSLFYDGQCGLCTKSIGVLKMLDWRKRLRFVDIHDEAERAQYAPDLQMADLDKSMHIRTSFGRTYKGFSAFRRLTWTLPLLRPLAPFLYIPGVKFIGDRVYRSIANRRKQCTHSACAL